jgi:hypothetical protein
MINNEFTIHEEYQNNMKTLDTFVMVAAKDESLSPTSSVHFGWMNATGQVSIPCITT